MDERSSSMRFDPLQSSPNGLMESFWEITVVLTVQVVGLMVIIISMAISLCHGEVPCCVVLISQ
jgi:hypothetical protein